MQDVNRQARPAPADIPASGSRDRALSWHLALLCLALILPVLILAAVLAGSYVGAEQKRMAQEGLRAAHDIVALSDRKLAGLISATEILSLSRALKEDDLDAFDRQARDVFRRLGINVVLRDRDSRQVVNTRLPRGAPLPTNVDVETDRAVLETRRPAVSNLLIGGVTRKPLFIVNVPVFKGDDIAYFLNLSLEPESVQELIMGMDRPAGWTIVMADRRGSIIAQSGKGDEVVGTPLPRPLWEEVRGGDGILGERVVAPPDEKALVAFDRSDLSGWVALVMLPSAHTTAPLRHSLMGLSTLAAGMLVLAAVLALVFSRRIERPVGRLALEAERLGQGEAVRPLETVVREVNMLSATLSEAAAKRRRAETALRESEERYRALASATREGVAIHSRWRVIEVNRAFWTMFGYASREDVVGRRPLHFIPAFARSAALADARKEMDEPFQSVGLRSDGSIFPIELCTRFIVYQGQPMWVEVVRDLTVQKATEAALRDGEARLQLAQAAGGVGTWDWDALRQVATCSESYCRLYGLDPQSQGHQSPEAWLAQVHPDDRERVMELRQAAMASGRLESEYRIVRPDGSVRWIVDRGLAMYDSTGRLIRFLGANVDVTEARLAEERLRELQSQLLHASRLSAMGEMTAALAHELNQPLGAAANFLNAARIALMGDEPDSRERALTRLDRATQQTLRAGAILRRLRSFVAQGDIDRRIVRTRPLVEDAVALALVGARDAELRTRLDFGPDDPPILVDAIQIQQVVFNLVKNALEATEGRHPREITVATRVTFDDEVEISVADNGPGLPDDGGMLFRPFATTKAEGLGIGLSICRAIVDAHGGRLWAEQRPGGGAMFLFTVPAARQKEVTDDERSHHPRGG